MPLILEDSQLKPDMVGRCEQMLAEWDTRDPWHPLSTEIGKRLLTLAYQALELGVPLLASPEAAAKFLRPIVKYHRQTE